jgi:hypothetical protein
MRARGTPAPQSPSNTLLHSPHRTRMPILPTCLTAWAERSDRGHLVRTMGRAQEGKADRTGFPPLWSRSGALLFVFCFGGRPFPIAPAGFGGERALTWLREKHHYPWGCGNAVRQSSVRLGDGNVQELDNIHAKVDLAELYWNGRIQRQGNNRLVDADISCLSTILAVLHEIMINRIQTL